MLADGITRPGLKVGPNNARSTEAFLNSLALRDLQRRNARRINQSASFCLYYAFKRGPVKLVAPLIASYPILSISWAIWIGTPISKFQILAVLAIIFGVSIVAVLSDISEEKIPPIGKTIALSLIAAIAFACTFASGQAAAELSPHMSATLVTRIISIMLCAIIIYFAGLKYWPGKSAIPWLIAMGCADGLALW